MRLTSAARLLVLFLMALMNGTARAQLPAQAQRNAPEVEGVPIADPGADSAAAAAAAAAPSPPEVVGDETETATSDDLREQIAELQRQLAETKDLVLRGRPTVTVAGYIDFGYFAPSGDGSGVIQDLGPATSRWFPQYAQRYGWVFLGDLLAPAVNSRGEAAYLGNFAGVTATDRFDGIKSHGAPSFIVNEVNFTLNAAMGDNALATASVDFLPRSGVDFALGDLFEVDIAQIEWMPAASRGRTSIFVGKVDSVLGIEYRERKASQRFGITPSLIARYTTGTPLGIKLRSKVGTDGWLILTAAVSNGSSTIEAFHFYDEIDSNIAKTGSVRIAAAPGRRLELGLSGEFGAQDHALDTRDPLWFLGADAQVHLGRFELKGQWLIGRGKGETNLVYDSPNRPYGLRLNAGAYLEGDLMVSPRFGVLARADLRDALVWLGNPNAPTGAERIYVTKGWRATVGARFVPNEHVVLKAEYLHNGEYGGVPSIPDDVFTSSLILIF